MSVDAELAEFEAQLAGLDSELAKKPSESKEPSSAEPPAAAKKEEKSKKILGLKRKQPHDESAPARPSAPAIISAAPQPAAASSAQSLSSAITSAAPIPYADPHRSESQDYPGTSHSYYSGTGGSRVAAVMGYDSAQSERLRLQNQERQDALYQVAAAEAKGVELVEGVNQKYAKPKKKKFIRYAAGSLYVDETLADWPENDFRVFCGDLGGDVSDAMLAEAFEKYPSFVKARVIRHKITGKSKGFGFVSFLDPSDRVKAMKEMDGKYVGQRPLKLKASKSAKRDVSRRGAQKLLEQGRAALYQKKGQPTPRI